MALDTNQRSVQVLRRCGFAFEGTLRNFRLVRGQPRDYTLYARVAAAAPDSAGATEAADG